MTQRGGENPGDPRRSAAIRLRDGVARTSGLQSDDGYSGTAGAFVAALFAFALLAVMFIALSDHLRSHWKAGVVVVAGGIAWIQLAAFIRRGLRRPERRWQVLLGAFAVLVIAAIVYYGLGIQVLKWFAIVVAGFYFIKVIVYILERYCPSILGKGVVWLVLLAAAIFIAYQVRL